MANTICTLLYIVIDKHFSMCTEEIMYLTELMFTQDIILNVRKLYMDP